jgi:hypothetical protein
MDTRQTDLIAIWTTHAKESVAYYQDLLAQARANNEHDWALRLEATLEARKKRVSEYETPRCTVLFF